MAFNGSGTYTLPAGNPVVTGTTISSSWANTTLSDIASALTNCVTRDGQSPATANVPLGGFKLTGVGAPTASGDALAWGGNGNLGTLSVTTINGNPAINGFTGSTAVINIGSNQFYKDTAGNVGFGVVPTAGINAAVQTKDGVKFPATQVASTDPNVLDDYEEGSLLPTFAFVTPGTGTISTINRYGTYVKVGKQVNCSIRCEVGSVSVGTASNGIYIDGLPFFSEAATYASYSVSVVATNFVNAPTVGLISNASKQIRLYKYGASGATSLAVTDIQAGSVITATISYFVD